MEIIDIKMLINNLNDIAMGKCSGNIIMMSKNYGEIVWLVKVNMQENKVLLLSQNVIGNGMWHNDIISESFEDSSLFFCLNNEFLTNIKEALIKFFDARQNVEILEVKGIVLHLNLKRIKKIQIKVSLLEKDDVSKYLSDEERICYDREGKQKEKWWLKSKKDGETLVNIVTENGTFNEIQQNQMCGIRPVIWIELNKFLGLE